MPPVEEVFNEERPPDKETMNSDVQIHALKYKVNTATNEACFYIENVDETSQSINKLNKRFLWQSQKWIVNIFDVAELPVERRKNKLILREIRRRSRHPDEGKDYEVTEIVSVYENSDQTDSEIETESIMGSTLREYIWKPKNVNKDESYVLVVYVDEGENPDEILGKPSSYSLNTSAMDFEVSFDDFLDSLNDHVEERPQGGLAKLTYVSEKLIHIKQDTENESETEEFYEIQPINMKLLYEQPITWVSPYEGKYGLSTSHFQLSERYGDSLESKLLKVTTRGGYLSDFSLSFSEVKQIKKSRDQKNPAEPSYKDIPKDTIIIDKLDKLKEAEEKPDEESTNGKLSPVDDFSDDEGFEEISLPVEQKPVKVEKKIQTADQKSSKVPKVTLKQLAVPVPESENDSVYNSESPVEDIAKSQKKIAVVDTENNARNEAIILNHKNSKPLKVHFSFYTPDDLESLKTTNKPENISLEPEAETIYPKPSTHENDSKEKTFKLHEINTCDIIEVKPSVVLTPLSTQDNVPIEKNHKIHNNKTKVNDKEEYISEQQIPILHTCDSLIDEIDRDFDQSKQNNITICTFDEDILPIPDKDQQKINKENETIEIETDKILICPRGLKICNIESHELETPQPEYSKDQPCVKKTEIEIEDEVSPIDAPSELQLPDFSALEKNYEESKRNKLHLFPLIEEYTDQESLNKVEAKTEPTVFLDEENNSDLNIINANILNNEDDQFEDQKYSFSTDKFDDQKYSFSTEKSIFSTEDLQKIEEFENNDVENDSIDGDSFDEEKNLFETFDKDIRASSPNILSLNASVEVTLPKRDHQPIVNHYESVSVKTTSEPIFLNKTNFIVTKRKIEEDVIAKERTPKEEVLEEQVADIQNSESADISFDTLIEDDKKIEEQNDFVNLTMDLTLKHNSENNFFYCAADDEKVIERSPSFLNRQRNKSRDTIHSEDENDFFIIKPIKLETVVSPTKLKTQENTSDHSFEEILEVEETQLQEAQMLSQDPFESFESFENFDDQTEARIEVILEDSEDYWKDEELETYQKENTDPGQSIGTIQYNTVFIRSSFHDPISAGKYSRQSSSTSTVSSTYNEEFDIPEKPKQKTLKKKAKSIILRPFKKANEEIKTKSLPGKLSSKTFSYSTKSKKRHNTDSELPIPTITQRIELLRENSSDNLLGEKTFRTSKRVESYKAFRSKSTGSILDTVDIEAKRKEKERKERRRRLAGYSFVNSDFDPNRSIIKSREYTIDACAKEVERERYFIRRERKKASQWSNRNMSVSTDKIDIVKSIGNNNTFYRPHDHIASLDDHSANVGKVKIPRAFSVEDLLSDNNNMTSNFKENLI